MTRLLVLMQMLADLETFTASEQTFLRILAHFLNLGVPAVRIQSVTSTSRRLLQSSLDLSVTTDVASESADAATASLEQDGSLNALVTSAGLPDIVVVGVVRYCGDGHTPARGACEPCTRGWYKSEPDNSSCVACPSNASTASSGSARVTDCSCLPGFLLATPSMSASVFCAACPADSYCPGGSTEQACPQNTVSAPRSSELGDCACNKGFHGLPEQCQPCPPGQYKASPGPEACVPCPGNSFSPAGSTSVGECVCNAGFQPRDTGGCGACQAGTYRTVGQPACVRCEAGKFQASAGATTCETCPGGTLPGAGATTCFEAERTPQCFSTSLALEAECPVASVPLRGCATSMEEFETISQQVTVEGTTLATIGASCRSFYEWVCPELGASAGDTLDCNFYCNFFARGMSEQMASGCASSDACVDRGLSTFELRPGNNTLCVETARYALYTSCIFPPSDAQAFFAAADEMIAHASNPEACPEGEQERMEVSVVGAASAVVSPPLCFDETECRYVCFNAPFAVTREYTLITILSQYVGDCDCSTFGAFSGTLEYGAELAIQAENRAGDKLRARPLRAFNVFAVTVTAAGLACQYTWQIDTGSFLGLPTEDVIDATPQAVLGFEGFDEDLSGTDADDVLAQWLGTAPPFRRASPGRFHHRGLLQGAPLAWECPSDDSDCRYACLSAGFTLESFGATVVLVWAGEDVPCDCSKVFPTVLDDGTPMLSGQVKKISSREYIYRFEAMVAFLGPVSNVSAAFAATQLATAELRAFDQEFLAMDLGPGLCTYKWRVIEGTILGVQSSQLTAAAIANRLEFPTALVQQQLDADTAASEDRSCGGAQTCEVHCILAGTPVVSSSGNAILGSASTTRDCECQPALGSAVGPTSFAAAGWTMTADPDRNALRYDYYSPQGAACFRYFNVANGTFLGIPRDATVAAALDERTNETVGITVKEAQDTATTLTVAVGSAVVVSVASAVASAAIAGVAASTTAAAAVASAAVATVAVTPAAGAAAVGALGTVATGTAGASTAAAGGGGLGATNVGAQAGSSGGGAVTQMIAQSQFLALTSRVGGPNAQPEQTRALSEGLAWSNMHFWQIPYPNNTNDTNDAQTLRSATGEEFISGDDQERNCRLARDSDRELGAALLVSLMATLGSFVLRVFFNELIRWLNKRKGETVEHEVLPFPVWELQVFLITFTGIAESTGIAIASGCRAYEILGAFILLFIVCFIGCLLAIVVMAVWTGCIKWKPISWKATWAQSREEFARRKEGSTLSHKLKQTYMACLVLDNRGEWEVDDDNPRARVFGKRFLERMGGSFDSYRGHSWWFGFWGLFKVLITCLILAMIFSPSANALLVLIINAVDYVFTMVWFPDAQWGAFIQNTYRASINMSLLAVIFGYVQGSIPEDLYAVAFQTLAIVSIVPATLAAILGPIVNLIRNFKALVSSLIALCSVGGVGHSVRAMCCANAAVIYGDDFVQTEVLDAMDNEDTRHKDGHQHQRFGHSHRQLPGLEPAVAGDIVADPSQTHGALGRAANASPGGWGVSRAAGGRAELVSWTPPGPQAQVLSARLGQRAEVSEEGVSMRLPAPATSFADSFIAGRSKNGYGPGLRLSRHAGVV